MASRAKFYDGESAQVHEVSVRPSSSELIVYRPTDLVVLARWPAAELRILGDVEHEGLPFISRKGNHARQGHIRFEGNSEVHRTPVTCRPPSTKQ